MKCIDRAMLWIVRKWEEIPAYSEPNPNDLLVLAHVIQSTCKTGLRNYNLDINEAQSVIRTVGDFMFDPARTMARGSPLLIRERTSSQLRYEMETLQNMLSDLVMIMGPDDDTLVSSLFLTGSFYTMAKLTRGPEELMQVPEKERDVTFKRLLQISKQNSWVRAGMILARLSRPNRPMHEDWIPKESIYWQNLFNQVESNIAKS